MNAFYQVVGISKQAVAQYANRQTSFDLKVEQLILEADDLCKEHPG